MTSVSQYAFFTGVREIIFIYCIRLCKVLQTLASLSLNAGEARFTITARPVSYSLTCSNKSRKDPALSKLDNFLLLPEFLQDGDTARPGCWRSRILGIVAVPAAVQNTVVLIIKIRL